ncbi:aminodeoxychorismate synthase component I [Geminicoccus roseus]|uniref:aminodeoxychorismate synthase component I n=1 Tax=Geminicoccus roseus TaxID=404900 RepID=UPI00040EB97B|nr:aminodeoxychorismate synthase component I [Geminicoccus roseus]
MRLLLVDNYDSFTFNLAQLVAVVSGAEPWVVKNDQVDLDQVAAFGPDAVILSPGPGRPDRPADFGICTALIRSYQGPILGVCLGHQGLAAHGGGRIGYARTVMHGRPSRIRHLGTGLFHGLPQDFRAIRYHSLLVTEPGPDFEPVAWSDDGIIMALRHRHRPLHGVQFHPESIDTEHGAALVRNFLDLVVSPSAPRRIPPPRPCPATARPAGGELQLFTRAGPCAADPERSFVALYGRSGTAFWLDSARLDAAGARWSFMGDGSGPHARQITYRVADRGIPQAETHPSVFDDLERWLDERRIERPAGLDVPFLPGWVGYLGYELKADAGGAAAHHSSLPDAQLLFADRIVAFDHATGRVVLLALDHPGQQERADAWFDVTLERITEAPSLPEPPPPCGRPIFRPHLADDAYLERIAAAQQAIRQGESYEICLTNEYAAQVEVDPLDAYRRLRRINPAPFAAFLRFGDLAILSSSPERFLSIDAEGSVQACPIKGTIARGADERQDRAMAEKLRSSVKDRSEHLMIVDLLRNDLGKVCATGSVHVPDLFRIERYATVHQMVSTICGRLRGGTSPIACVRAAFPGGSMTGAPKLRTMRILDELEGRPRGIYSGAIGYLGSDGRVDLSIVIRTAVVEPGRISIGAGGAIVDLSDPLAELAEVRLKCQALVEAFGGRLEGDATLARPAAMEVPA